MYDGESDDSQGPQIPEFHRHESALLTREQDAPTSAAEGKKSAWAVEIPRFAYKHGEAKGFPGYSLQLVAIRRRDQHRWHVRIVVEEELVSAPTTRERRETLEQLCHAIDFDMMALLDDTLTEAFIHSKGCGMAARHLFHSPLPEGLAFNPDGETISVNTREDPARFLFPPLHSTTTTRLIQWDQVREVESIALATYIVRLLPDANVGGPLYILKSIERNMYIFEDTPALESELRVLEQVGGRDHIVRLVAAVVSENPYSSTPGANSETSSILRGILLEYHPAGTLEAALKTRTESGDANGDVNAGSDSTMPWQLWAAQLCAAVATLHEHEFTHMDIKCSNMVIDKEKNLVLIDIGGAGGFTWEWLSPAMSQVEEPLEASFEDRKQNDMWAVGKVLLLIAEAAGDIDERRLVEAEASKLMSDPPLASLRQVSASLFFPPSHNLANQ
ncbi:hypothetical protein SEPCBS57363_004342 [Sporothrix epigloea]|uniref:Protein kinase domain-containing protein n=1 Tax=Sporothrix epigloea TaxID=1892477 RepID=A0ABP0DVJ3_9PEZI